LGIAQIPVPTTIDYGFFYNNLKQNVADRIKAFLDK
jgi:hypothetical protein